MNNLIINKPTILYLILNKNNKIYSLVLYFAAVAKALELATEQERQHGICFRLCCVFHKEKHSLSGI